MQVKFDINVLTDAIKRVEKVLKSNISIPILQGIYMECTEHEIILVGSDTHETLRFHIPVDGQNADVIKPGKVVLPKQAIDLIKKVTKDIHLQLDGQILVFKYGKKSEVRVNALHGEEYPKLPELNLEQPTLIIKGSDIDALIRKTMFAASTSEMRPILQGINVVINSDSMLVSSTDSHRLASVKLQQSTTSEVQLVIPAKAFDKMAKIFDLKEDVCVFFGADNQAIFKNGSLILYSRLLEGKYPDTSKLIPNVFSAEVKLNRLEFLEILDRISSLSKSADNGKGGIVKLHVNGAAEISTDQSQVGKAVEVMDYEELSGESNFDLAFSGKYMTEALKSIDDDCFLLKYTGNMRPFLVTPTTSNDSFEETQLILPVRTI